MNDECGFCGTSVPGDTLKATAIKGLKICQVCYTLMTGGTLQTKPTELQTLARAVNMLLQELRPLDQEELNILRMRNEALRGICEEYRHFCKRLFDEGPWNPTTAAELLKKDAEVRKLPQEVWDWENTEWVARPEKK